MNKILKYLKNQRGEGDYTDVLIKFVIIMSLVATFVYLPGPFVKKQNVNQMCRAIVTSIESTGEINREIQNLIDELKHEYNMEAATVKIEGNFINVGSVKRIQLREKFWVTVEDKSEVKIFDPMFGEPVTVDIPLRKKLLGISQVYWKASEL